jgi:tripeptide aminopeptidase
LNLFVDLLGQGTLKNANRLLFLTHMDTVPLCAGAEAVRRSSTRPRQHNRTGCAVLVTLAVELFRQKLDHPPLTLLFTLREESGLRGESRSHDAKFVKEITRSIGWLSRRLRPRRQLDGAP